MSRTARVVIAGLVTAGALTLGAGFAYAAEPGDGHHDDGSKGTSHADAPKKKAPSATESSAGGGGGLPGGDVVGELLGSLPVGL